MSELPKGWAFTTIGDVCLKPEQKTPDAKASFKYIDISCIDRVQKRICEPETISGHDAPSRARKIVNTGDVLVSMTRPNLNAVALVPRELDKQIASTGFDVLKPLIVEPRWLFAVVRSKKFIDTISGETIGALYPACKADDIRNYEIPLPPQAEQTRIVEKLDEVLAQVDTIKARLDGIPAILKRFRQSVLAAAVSGRLTEAWREINPPSISADLFHQAIHDYRYEQWLEDKLSKHKEKGKEPKNDGWKSKYEPPKFEKNDSIKLPTGWIQEVLEGLVYISARIGWKGLKAEEYTESGPLFLSVHGLNYGDFVNLKEAFHISQERYEESPEIMLKNDDILLCKDGAGIGKIAIVKDLNEKATINSSLLLIRAGKYFDTKYLYYFLSGPKMQSLVIERMTGSAVPHLFQRDVKEFILDVPPIQEQKEIVRLVDQYLGLANTIEAQVKKAQARVNNLTQSILAKAFRGELVAQDPSDEPAEKLLARIAQARKEAEALAKAAKKVAKTK